MTGPWFPSLRGRLIDRIFPVLERLDEWTHRYKRVSGGPLCRLVGKLEVGYYERMTDWRDPLFVDPKRLPELYLKHAADLCAHGYRQDCPHGCTADTR